MATDMYGLQGRKMEAPRLAKCIWDHLLVFFLKSRKNIFVI